MAVAEFSVKQLSQLTSTINDDLFEALLKLALEYFKSGGIPKDLTLDLRKSSKLSSRDFDLLLNRLIFFIRKLLKLEYFPNDTHFTQRKLLNELRLPESKNQLLQKLLIEPESRLQLTKDVGDTVRSPPVVIKVDWRLDVIIGSSDSSEEMKPVIIFKFTTNKGMYSCHCTLAVFHQLRAAVATSLKEIYFLSSKK